MSRAAARGRAVGALLAGAWRADPPPLEPSPALEALVPVLVPLGAASFVYPRVRPGGAAALAGLEQMRDAWRLTRLRSAVLAREVALAFRRLRAAGIEAFLAKGWAAARHYADPALRPAGDIDLYVAAPERRRAWEALGEPGMVPHDVHGGWGELDDRDPAEMRRRARTVAVEGVEARLLGPEDHLRLLALHGLRHGFLRPVWLLDVAAALEDRGAGFDWDYLASGDARRTEWCRAALRLAASVLGARLAGTPLEREPEPPAWTVAALHREWGAPRLPHGARAPIAQLRHDPRSAFTALRVRWPNPIEAAFGVSAPPGAWPRWPLQIAWSLRRAAALVGCGAPGAETLDPPGPAEAG